MQMQARLSLLRKLTGWVNLATPELAKIAREREIQENPAGKTHLTRGQNDLNRNKTNLKCKQETEKNSMF